MTLTLTIPPENQKMTRLEIKASFPVSDNQREVARIMAKLDEPTAAFEERPETVRQHHAAE